MDPVAPIMRLRRPFLASSVETYVARAADGPIPKTAMRSAPSSTRTAAAIWARHFSDRRTSRPSTCACRIPSRACPVAFSRSTSVRRMSSAGVETEPDFKIALLRSARLAKPSVWTVRSTVASEVPMRPRPRAAAELANTICRFSSMNFATRRPVAPSCSFRIPQQGAEYSPKYRRRRLTAKEPPARISCK